MKNYLELSFRYLKKERKRTLLTIFGIVISIAMITSVFTIINSSRNVMINQAIMEEGSYHGSFSSIEKSTINNLKNYVGIEEVGVQRELGFGEIEKIPETNKNSNVELPKYRYLRIMEESENSINLNAIELLDGRLPNNSNEIILEETALLAFEKKHTIGDKINLSIVDDMEFKETSNNRLADKSYEIVGVIKSKHRYPYNYITNGITKLDELREDVEYDVIFKLDKVKGASEEIFNIGENLKIPKDNITTNYKLLRLSAESIDKTFSMAMRNMVIFIVGIIIICTIAVIYNSFNISIIERISEFGILRAIGMKRNEILAIVILEAITLYIVSLPLGITSGFVAMHLVFFIIKKLGSEIYFLNGMSVEPTLLIIGFTAVLGLITVLLSAIVPALKASKISPIEAIRNSREIKVEKINKVKNSNIIRKLFGFEGEIAYKNLSRNKGRFFITVFSMVISIVLFIVFSSFSENIYKLTDLDQEVEGEMFLFGDKDTDIASIENELYEIDAIKEVTSFCVTEGTTVTSLDKINSKTKEIIKDNIFEDGENLKITTNIMSVSNENLVGYGDVLLDGIIDIKQMNKKNGVLLINNTKLKPSIGSKDNINPYKFKVGDKIKVENYNNEIYEYEIMGILDRGNKFTDRTINGVLNIITTNENLYKYNSSIRSNIMIETKDNEDLKELRDYLESTETNYNVNYLDIANYVKEENLVKLILNIFLYGFVILIAIISSINIINTISTNIILRTKEISVLKAVGMSVIDISKMIALEGIYYSFYAIVFGVTTGIGLSYLLFIIMVGIAKISYSIPVFGIVISILGTFIISLFSGIYPLKKINEKIIIENIRD